MDRNCGYEKRFHHASNDGLYLRILYTNKLTHPSLVYPTKIRILEQLTKSSTLSTSRGRVDANVLVALWPLSLPVRQASLRLIQVRGQPYRSTRKRKSVDNNLFGEFYEGEHIWICF